MYRFVLTSLAVCVFAWPAVASSDFAVEAVLRQDALQAGYTVTNPAGTARLGVPAKAIKRVSKVRVKLNKVSHPERYDGDMQPISDLYRYSLHHSQPWRLRQALWLGLSYPSAYTDGLVIKYYDAATHTWKRLHHQATQSHQSMQQGTLKKKRGIVAVFAESSNEAVVQGIASWYDWTGAACNAFPLGSRIRVSNVATGASVDATVVSTGPFIPGRVVDLPRADFAQIADVSAGVVEVTVHLLE